MLCATGQYAGYIGLKVLVSIARSTINGVVRIHNKIRDDRYLIGLQLNNLNHADADTSKVQREQDQQEGLQQQPQQDQRQQQEVQEELPRGDADDLADGHGIEQLGPGHSDMDGDRGVGATAGAGVGAGAVATEIMVGH